MKDEIAAAVVFLSQLLRKNQSLPCDQVDQFQNHLSACLLERFKDHWYSTRPSKGQGYRCIRINDTEPIDPVLENAAKNSGLSYRDLGLPNELTLWVDPAEVTCRLGENHGCYTLVAQFKDGSSENVARKPDIDKLLAYHLDKKQAERAKFRLATTTRSNQKDHSLRSSPPMYGGYHGNSPPTYYNNSNNWDGHMSAGYHGNEGYYGNNGWGNWGGQQVNNQQLSPNGNSNKSKNTGKHHQRSQQGASHHQSTFSNHPSDKLRWGKTGTVSKA